MILYTVRVQYSLRSWMLLSMVIFVKHYNGKPIETKMLLVSKVC